jgi:peptidyl-prolyl cis-trans isomerase A (cyclophilin A)
MKRYLMVVCAVAALSGCSSSPTKSPESSAPAVETKKAVTAPAQFNVKFDTSKGPFTLEVHRDWAPRGVDHFYELVQDKFFDDARFFRVVRNFVVQFGINKDPKVTSLWGQLNLPDDPVKQSNVRGTITYATAGPNTRTTQLFLNLANNRMLDSQGFAPFGKVTSGMAVVDSLYSGYGDMPPGGSGPDPTKIETQGNDYLARYFGRLDYIKTARVESQ